MITTDLEYRTAQEELSYLRNWVSNLAADTSTPRAGYTAISVQSMIARISKEIAEYEGSLTKSSAAPSDSPTQTDPS